MKTFLMTALISASLLSSLSVLAIQSHASRALAAGDHVLKQPSLSKPAPQHHRVGGALKWDAGDRGTWVHGNHRIKASKTYIRGAK